MEGSGGGGGGKIEEKEKGKLCCANVFKSNEYMYNANSRAISLLIF